MATVKEKKTARKQSVKATVHAQKAQERKNDRASVKAAYLDERDGIVLTDVFEKARSFAAYHTKMAKDGVGAKVTGTNESGNDIVETVYLTPDQRLTALDKASGIEQLLGYFERQIELPKPVAVPTTQTVVE